MSHWQFFIDVGGTFTDVVALQPDGAIRTYKLLSSGAIRGVARPRPTRLSVQDESRTGKRDDFWKGYRFAALGSTRGSDATIPILFETRIERSDGGTGDLFLGKRLPSGCHDPLSYELRSNEEAPVLAIRYLMGLRLSDPIGEIEVRLGTTRATNALLERKGAKLALVTTRGFGDILRIGYQDRPALFQLNICKRDDLFERVVEIDERLDAQGCVLRSPDRERIRFQLAECQRLGVEALAICLLHSHVNPFHEELVARLAEEVGFVQVSVSSRLSRLERIVPRGDTASVDAYLSGVIRAYVASLRRSLPQARILLMTSAGGLIDADSVHAKDTILSGPAGGVVGCAHVSVAAGIDRSIGFDMGGTSTDVCRIEPPPRRFEYTQETVKAGVRIQSPMLAVETVAAGGGSICDFDGQKLTVGPQSAGADPGPACYGRKGPLTITDMNLLLGRMVADHFPFRLDRSVVEHKAEALGERIFRAMGTRLSKEKLAEGFIEIANVKMAEAIRKISVAQGYDVREYTLVTFGGAGPQHACGIARALGMRRILCNPYAGVLSAVGIGVAEVKRMDQRSVRETLSSATLAQMDLALGEMEQAMRRSLARELSLAAQVRCRRTLDLCYEGQATFITVESDREKAVRAAFERLHEQLYGYRHTDRSIEVRVIRVELAAPSANVDLSPQERARPNQNEREALPSAAMNRTVSMVVDGQWRDVPLLERKSLVGGEQIIGPAIVIEETSTIVIEAGWQGIVTIHGDLLLDCVDSTSPRGAPTVKVDPVQLEVFNNRFAAVAERMGEMLRRTALSTNVKERLDFSCAVFSPRGDLVVNAPHIPVHLGGMSECVKCLIADVGHLAPGDVLITNDPYRGGSHLNDVTVVTPVYDINGRHILFFVANRAHHAEIGGKRPGSMPPDSTKLAEEGVVIRSFRLMKEGQPQWKELRALLTAPPFPSRTPEENLADIAAQVAANRYGATDLSTMIEQQGLGVVHGYMQHICDAAEAKMRAALLRIPSGTYRFEDQLDDGSPIRLAITVNGGRARLDFSGTGPVLRGNLNANRAIVASAALYCFRCLIDEDIPLNGGVLSPIEIILPDCLLNPRPAADPGDSPAVAGGNVETSQRIVDTIFGALRMVAASQGTMNNLLIGSDRFGYYETICGGGGAGTGYGGADAVHTHMTNTRMTDPEVLEARYPLRLIRFEIRRGSGGNGVFRGGDGVIREIEFLEPLEVSILSQRRTIAPYGLEGGGPGAPGTNRLRRLGAIEEETLPSIAQFTVKPGDRLTIATPGGGGWGKP